jgi:hypothetical protein
MKAKNSSFPCYALAFAGLAAIQPAAAQVYQLTSTGGGLLSSNLTNTSAYTSLQINQDGPWNGDPLGGMQMEEDVSYTDAAYRAYRDTTWIATGVLPGAPRAAAISTFKRVEFVISYPIRPYQTNAFRLEGVDLSLLKARLGFFGDNPLLSLNNSVLRFGEGQESQDALTSSSSFAISAAAGTANTIAGLSRQVGPSTIVSVPTGASLKFLNSGAVGPGLNADQRLWFPSEANNVVVDGGALTLERSHLIVGASGATNSKFEVKNRGQLSLNVSDTALQTNFLKVDGSSLILGANTKLLGHKPNWTPNPMAILELKNSDFTIGNSATFEAFLLEGSGTNTVEVIGNNTFNAVYPSVSSINLADENSRLTILGKGGIFYIGLPKDDAPINVMDLNGGRLVIAESAPGEATTFHIGQEFPVPGAKVYLEPRDASIKVSGTQTSLDIGRNAELTISDARCDMLLTGGASMNVQGQGLLIAEGSISGTPTETLTVEGDGTMDIKLRTSDVSAQLYLETSLDLKYASKTILTLRPSTGTSSSIVIEGDFKMEKFLGLTPILDLRVIDDTKLPIGTKLLLIDYSESRGINGGAGGIFMDTAADPIPNNKIFKLGMNWYQIRYSDLAYRVTNPGVITLTTVPAPYDSWISSYYPGAGQTAERAKSANPDGDNLNNWGEFATDGNPSSGVNGGKIVGKIATVNSEQVFTLTLPVRVGTVADPADPAGSELGLRQVDEGLSYKIQASTDLASWALTVTEVAGADANAIQLGLPALSSGWVYRTFRAPGTVVPGEPRKFMRAIFAE